LGHEIALWLYIFCIRHPIYEQRIPESEVRTQFPSEMMPDANITVETSIGKDLTTSLLLSSSLRSSDPGAEMEAIVDWWFVQIWRMIARECRKACSVIA
jgi:hypothetical protein